MTRARTRPAAPKITEAAFQAGVVKMARLLGWSVFHPRIMIGSASGWPDLVLWRPGRFLLRELKSDTGRLSPQQEHTLAELQAAGVDAGVWRPADWPTIEETLRA